MSLGQRVCRELLNHLFGKTPDTTPAGVIYVGLHVGNPGEDGQSGAEATGTGYARVATAATDWVVASLADPSLLDNANAITFPTAGGDWSTGSNFTYASLWTHATNSTESEYIGAALLGTAKPVLNGDTAEIAAGDLDVTMD